MSSSQLFIQRFNPVSLSAFILPDRIRNRFPENTPVSGHFLFEGTPGMGKSALAKHVARRHPNLYINASKDGTIDTIRGVLEEFCSEVAIGWGDTDDSVKVVILDEIDGVRSQGFMDALRGFMDMYSAKVRFIATCNRLSQVPDFIQSRFDVVSFGFENPAEEAHIRFGWTGRLLSIMTKRLEMTVEEPVLHKLVDRHFPDWRGALQTLQRLHNNGVVNVREEDLLAPTRDHRELFDLILSGASPENIHVELMGKYATQAKEVIEACGSTFIDFLIQERQQFVNMIPGSIVVAARYADTSMRIDPALAMKACVYELVKLAEPFRSR